MLNDFSCSFHIMKIQIKAENIFLFSLFFVYFWLDESKGIAHYTFFYSRCYKNKVIGLSEGSNLRKISLSCFAEERKNIVGKT